jgi:xylan 1,4-beta-xylosidase
VFQANLMKKILDLNELEQAQVREATTWSFYFEGERMFEGTRSFATANGVEKPLLNAYRMFGRLGATRLPAVSDSTWNVAELDAIAPALPPEEVDALATRTDDGDLAILVYRRTDDQYSVDDSAADVTVKLRGLQPGRYSLDHYRIDEQHSNAHTVWTQLGSPQHPTPEEIETMHSRMGLEEYEPKREVDVQDGGADISLSLPLHSVSLLVLHGSAAA